MESWHQAIFIVILCDILILIVNAAAKGNTTVAFKFNKT